MATITIAILLLLAGGFVGFIIMLQVKEQARVEKLKRASTLNNNIRQIRRYLDELPPQYQPKELRLWLFSCQIESLAELFKLQPDEPIKRRRSHAIAEMEEFRDGKVKRKARAISDELQIIELRRLFDSISNFLLAAKEQKKIDADNTTKFRDIMRVFNYKVSADHKAYLARQAFLTNRFEDTIMLYKEAITELNSIKDSAEAVEAIKRYQSLISDTEKELAQQQAQQAAEDAEAAQQPDEEWDKFTEQTDDFEKKKYF